jgi:pimeloyl-ACP methyl ester carboxylesterase
MWLGTNVDLLWDVPRAAEVLTRFASFSRVIVFDRRGIGASDAVSLGAIPTWEEWTEDIVAVLNAVGSKRTAILASVDAGPIAILFAAMHPEDPLGPPNAARAVGSIPCTRLFASCPLVVPKSTSVKPERRTSGVVR